MQTALAAMSVATQATTHFSVSASQIKCPALTPSEATALPLPPCARPAAVFSFHTATSL
jgi:hypothetical protein